MSGRPPDESGARSELSGSARDVIQARDVSGGVHFHRADPEPAPVPRQLPGNARGFVGRIAETRQLDEALAHVQDDPGAMALLVITGTAGVGKTSLAVHWAHRVRHEFPDGQLYINLRGYDPGEPVVPDEALDRFLRALGMPADAVPADSQAKESAYRSMVADRRILIVLDNASSARQVRPLLPGTPSCVVLVTSRSRLSGLVAREGARRVFVDVLPPAEAVELLRRVTSDYRHDDQPGELSELARLCVGLPLALRIAGERAASRPQTLLRDLIASLRNETELWDVLSAGDEDDADAVRTVFAWSYRALPSDVAHLFCLLGLHPGPHLGLAAIAALAGESTSRTRQQLDVLVGAHLIEQPAPDRYQFHDLLRAYAVDKTQDLDDPVAIAAARDRLFGWYLHSAEAVAAALHRPSADVQLPPLPPGVAPLNAFAFDDAMHWHQVEQDNILAITRAAMNLGMDTLAWQLPALLRAVYPDRNPPGDWLTLGGIGLEAARRAGDRYGEAVLLGSLARALLHSGKFADAASMQRAGIQIWRDLGYRGWEARSLHNLGRIYAFLRKLDEAAAYIAAGREIADETGDELSSGIAAMTLGWIAGLEEEFSRSLEYLRQALPILRRHGHMHEATCLMLMAEAERGLGRPAQALETAEAGLAVAQKIGNSADLAGHLIRYARALRANGRHGDALSSYQYCASLCRSLANKIQEAVVLDSTGETYLETGRAGLAVDFHQMAVTLLRESADGWALAVALGNLASALETTGDMPAAVAAYREMLPLIADFPDRQAARLRARAEEKLRE